jgi:hypothetical protein
MNDTMRISKIEQLAMNKYYLLEQHSSIPSDSIEKIVALQAAINKTNTRNRNRNEFAWKKAPPKTNEPTAMVKVGQIYHFCINHKA